MAEHDTLTDIHNAAFVGTADPTIAEPDKVRANLLWIDTDASPPQFKLRDPSNTAWLPIATGPMGPAGADGGVGAPGTDGADGADGADGIDGAAGSVWRTGSGVPDNAVGTDGDYYLRTTTGDVYLRTAGAYAIVANIMGPAGADGADGAVGPEGPIGPEGPQGEIGPEGSGVHGHTDAGDGGVLTAPYVNGYVQFEKQADPPAPPGFGSDKVRLYASVDRLVIVDETEAILELAFVGDNIPSERISTQIQPEKLGTGTYDETTVLHGDSVYRVPQSLAIVDFSEPTDPVEGQLWLYTGTMELYVWNGTEWAITTGMISPMNSEGDLIIGSAPSGAAVRLPIGTANQYLKSDGDTLVYSDLPTLDDVVAGGASGLMSGTDKTKLNGIAAGATQNSSDGALVNRANHTGTQLAATISDFGTAAGTVAGGLITTHMAIDATPSVKGHMTAAQATKLNNISIDSAGQPVNDRTMGWYDKTAPADNDTFGPVYPLRRNMTFIGVEGYARTAPAVDAPFQIQRSTDNGGTWENIYSTAPKFAASAHLPSGGVLDATKVALSAGHLLQRKWLTPGTVADVTITADVDTR